MEVPRTVAVINTTRDIIDLLRVALEHAGFVVVTALTTEIRDGHVDFDRMMRDHEPRVIVYDIAPPYDANFRLFEHLAARPSVKHAHFVLTSTNVRHVEHLGTLHQKVYEIVGKPLDIGEIVGAVNEAMHARPVR